MALGNVFAVFRFELRRAFTVPRIVSWLMLAGFPVLIVSLIRLIPSEIPREPWLVFLFALIPMLVVMLGTFLWTTPAVSAELEQQSWVYLAVKPGGRVAVLLGKYLAAVAWVLPAALTSLTLCVLIASTAWPWATGPGDVVQVWLIFAALACLSCPAYAAIYLALGTIFVKRSMVIAFAYTLIFELLVSLVPAIINKFTIQYRLRALFIAWTDLPLGDADAFIMEELIGSAPAVAHVLILLAYTLGLVVLAVWLVQKREYVTATAGDA